MHYMSNTYCAQQMLAEMGLNSVDDLFVDIPEKFRIDGLNLPDGRWEQDVISEMRAILDKNQSCEDMACFLGAGLERHYIPPLVGQLISRSELLTSYTPYQAEISQGILQILFEYQCLISELTGLEVSNSSLYDGSSAIGEAVLMSCQETRNKRFLVPRHMASWKKEVLDTYVRGRNITIEEYGFDRGSGQADLEDIEAKLGNDLAGIYIETPNFLGCLEQGIPQIRILLDNTPGRRKPLLVMGINLLSTAILKSPGEYGADIAIGEGQPLGNPINNGGPLLGFFAINKKMIRKLPGRLIGITKDSRDEWSFCMTLSTREQHIRRHRATSNICSNQALCAVAATIFISLAGNTGLKKLALINATKAQKLAERLNRIPGIKAPAFSSLFFNEFTVEIQNAKAADFLKDCQEKGVIPGLSLDDSLPELNGHLLTCVTEMNSTEDLEKLVECFEKREVVQ